MKQIFLSDLLLSTGKTCIYIPDFIKENAKTNHIAVLRKQFEALQNDPRFNFVRTSEIIATGGTKRGEKELKYYPVIRDYLMSHVEIIKTSNEKTIEKFAEFCLDNYSFEIPDRIIKDYFKSI